MASDTQHDALSAPTTQIRETAKWLVAGLAAVGAVLVAGSQLASLGKLDLGSPLSGDTWQSTQTARLWIALLGLVVALGAVLLALRATLPLLVPQDWPLRAVVDEFAKEKSPARTFLSAHPEYLSPYATPQELLDRQEELERERGQKQQLYDNALDDGREAANEALKTTRHKLAAAYRHAEDLGALVGYVTLKDSFTLSKRWILGMAGAVALGTCAFAWAANPPDAAKAASLAGADLSGTDLGAAKLQKADLTGADLRSADLGGADLSGAVLDGVQWGRTTCPDGRLSDEVGGSCAGHLEP